MQYSRTVRVCAALQRRGRPFAKPMRCLGGSTHDGISHGQFNATNQTLLTTGVRNVRGRKPFERFPSDEQASTKSPLSDLQVETSFSLHAGGPQPESCDIQSTQNHEPIERRQRQTTRRTRSMKGEHAWQFFKVYRVLKSLPKYSFCKFIILVCILKNASVSFLGTNDHMEG